MYAIETQGLNKAFHGMNAVANLDMHVPEGSIYGFIGENGSGKSTTEKLICGLLVRSSGTIKLFGQGYTDADIRSKMGVLIENPACFPSSTVYQNLFMQALNLGIEQPQAEIKRVLELVCMGGAAGRKFKQCSLGMKQRIGVAQSLMGHPKLLILDEPINGLDADGMRIVRETLIELNRKEGVTILISSHILGELEKVATHYGIIRNGTLIKEMPASAMSQECRNFVLVKTSDNEKALPVLLTRYHQIEVKESGIRIYDEQNSETTAKFLFDNNIFVKEIAFNKIGLEEYYTKLMSKKEII